MNDESEVIVHGLFKALPQNLTRKVKPPSCFLLERSRTQTPVWTPFVFLRPSRKYRHRLKLDDDRLLDPSQFIVHYYPTLDSPSVVNRIQDFRRTKHWTCRTLSWNVIHWTAMFDNKYLGNTWGPLTVNFGQWSLAKMLRANTWHGYEKSGRFWWKLHWGATIYFTSSPHFFP